ncbi:MAG: redoxin domain-containing protein, partial [Planctomycetia bacterium]|nr:redoxin domain-containing protein [Planctomycetia bacterium]
MSHHLILGKPAPLFTASSTRGLISLKDYAGKWVILLCNPTEFNTWRKNEFISLMKHAKTFNDRGAELLPISTDPKATHLQWFYGNARLGSYTMPFPIIDDRNGEVAGLYGIHPSNESRTPANMQVFIISPDQTLLKTLSYPALGNS